MTNRQDVTADLVVLEMTRRSVPFVRFNTEDFPTRVGLVLSVPGDDVVSLPKAAVTPEAVRSVWYRRPVAPVLPAIDDAGAADFALSEAQAALEELWSRLDCLWVSRPSAIEAATPRLAQLRAAREVGLEVPPTLLTNDPDYARAFIAEFGPVVVKPVRIGLVPGSADVGPRLVFTQVVASTEVDDCLASLRLGPMLFQKLVEPGTALRVNVVGRRVFATAIATPPGSSIDWREVAFEDLRHAPVELPASLEQSLVALVSRLGLAFGAIDLIRDDAGLYHFLEINPNGQWAWIEQQVGTPIAAALVDLLEAPRL